MCVQILGFKSTQHSEQEELSVVKIGSLVQILLKHSLLTLFDNCRPMECNSMVGVVTVELAV